jgi:hypothetical protein
MSLYTVSWLQKYSLNTHFVLFCFLHLPVGIVCMRLQQQSASKFGLHFPLYLFFVWKISRWNLLPCSSERPSIFSGKKSKWECWKWSFNDMFQSPALHDEICSCTISLFLQMFSNVFQVPLHAEFNVVLKTWSSNSFLFNFWTNEYFFCHLQIT